MISVIIPTYNCGKYVANAIKSVCAQTYTHFEIIVIDDGSTDNTEEVVRSIADPRLRYIKKAQEGNYFARNRGLAEARGEYVVFLDADDIILPNKFAVQLEKFLQDPELGLCCTSFYVQFADQEDRSFVDTSFSFSSDFNTESGFIERALENNFILTSTIMVRRECVERLGDFDTRFQNAMDYEFCLRMAFHYKACYLSERLTVRLEHSANISKNKINTYRALLYIFSHCVPRFSRGRFYEPKHAALIQRKWQKSLYYLGLEHLMLRHFADADRCLQRCRYAEKSLFKMIAIIAARFRSDFLASLISSYRWKRQQERLFPVLKP